MCGISGFFHFETEREASTTVAKRMNDTLHHRGPDGEGIYIDKNIALNHRRLSILDILGGNQPMESRDGNIALIFNGEIYNYLELKGELMSIGCEFETNSDTEVIINAYRVWGLECQNKFNGMWAFALWDRSKNLLFISRDRIGEKPLYYSKFDNTFVFGSEIKALLSYGVPHAVATNMIELYLSLSFIPAPFTFYKYIQQLEPGSYLIVNRDGMKKQYYWKLPDIDEKDLLTEKSYVEHKFEQLFDDAVKIRMRSDAPYGAFLSGGLDSSSIVSRMALFSEKPISTFTMGSEHSEFDERALARLVSEKFRTVHHEGILRPENFESKLAHVLFHFDEPFGDASAIPTGQISEYTKEYVKMVLTGDGGDEVLSGYSTYQGEMFVESYQKLPSAARNFSLELARLVGILLRGKARYRCNRIVKVLEASNQSFERRLLYKISHVPPNKLSKVISPEVPRLTMKDYLSDVFSECRFSDPFYKLMYFHHKITLPGDMLTKVDRMSMSHSLETRTPFLDYRIIELLYSTHKKIKTNLSESKLILRNTIANKSLPTELLKKNKKGFSVPLRDWFKEKNLDNFIRKKLVNDNDSSLLIGKALLEIIDENNTSKYDWGNFIWSALVLMTWLEQKN